MKPTDDKKEVRAEKPLDATFDYELYAAAPQQETIDLTEMVEEETPVGKGGASATRKPAGAPQGFEPVRENQGEERRTLGTRPELRPAVIALTASAKGESGAVRERRSEWEATRDERVLWATEPGKRNAGCESAEDVEADQTLSEFFSYLEAGDGSENLMGLSGTFHRRSREEPASIKTDAFNELLEEMESIERAITQETRESHSTAAKPVSTVRLRGADWAWSDICYPQRILTSGRKIGDVRAQTEDPTRRYQDFRSLLCASGNQLKRAVVRVFRIHRNL